MRFRFLLFGIALLFLISNAFAIDNNVFFDENFNDGDYVSPPYTWTVGAGAYSAATTELAAQSGTASYIYTPLDLDYTKNSGTLQVQFRMRNTANVSRFSFNAQTNTFFPDGYMVIVFHGATIKLERVDSIIETTLITGPLAVIDTNYWIKVLRTADGNFSLYVNGTYYGSAVDTTYTSQPYIETFGGDGFGDEYIIDDINFSYLVGTFKVHFYDENTGQPITPTVFANGIQQTLVGNLLSYDLNQPILNNCLYIYAYDLNRSKRDFHFCNLNVYNADKNLFLLASNLGRQIDFSFYKPDQKTPFSNAIVSVRRKNDQNYAGIAQLNSQGEASFFLNPDANYTFDIDENSDRISDYNYIYGLLTVNIPKDESTGVNITPYRIQVSGLADYDFNGLTGTKTFPVFLNTSDFYRIQISAVGDAGLQYSISRKYSIRTIGNPTTEILQPYLVSDISGGFYSALTIIDFYSRFPLKGIVIRSETSTPSGVQLVEKVKTDSLGKAILAFILNKQYTLYFDSNDSLETNIGNVIVNATSATYTFALKSSSVDLNFFTSRPIDYNYLQLGKVKLNSSNQFDLNWSIFSSDGTLIIKSVNWHVYDSTGTTLINQTTNLGSVSNYSGGNTFTYIRPDYNTTLHSVLTVTLTNDTNLVFDPVFLIFNFDEKDLAQTMKDIQNMWGGLGTTLLAIIIALGIHGFVSDRRPEANTNGLVFLVAATTGFFVVFGWIPAGQFAVACLFGLGSWVYANRGG
jgi:hypothetical protein